MPFLSLEELKKTGHRGPQMVLVSLDAQRTIQFLKDVFDGEESFMYKSDKHDGKIMHSTVVIDGRVLAVEDHVTAMYEPWTSLTAPLSHMLLPSDDAAKTEAKLLALGCKSCIKVEKQFWGDDFGMVQDKEGIYWSLISNNTCPKRWDIPLESERSIVPNLNVDKPHDYIAFLKEAFGAEVSGTIFEKDGFVMHAEIIIDGAFIYVNQTMNNEAPKSFPIFQPDFGQGAACEARALQHGGKTKMKVEKQFWGSVYGHFLDPVGLEYGVHEACEHHAAKRRGPMTIAELKSGCGLRGVIPVVCSTDCKKHHEFMQSILGAEEYFIYQDKDKDNKVMHGALHYRGRSIYSEDAVCGLVKELQDTKESTAMLMISVPDSRAVYKKFIDAGATEVVPIDKQWWGVVYGVVKDIRGVLWGISSPATPDKPVGAEIPWVSEHNLLPMIEVTNAREYIAWLHKTLEAELKPSIMPGEGGRIEYSELGINHGLVAVLDAPADNPQTQVHIMVQVPEGKAAEIESRALSAGGKSVMKVEKQPWGIVHGEVQDNVDGGIVWDIIEEDAVYARSHAEWAAPNGPPAKKPKIDA